MGPYLSLIEQHHMGLVDKHWMTFQQLYKALQPKGGALSLFWRRDDTSRLLEIAHIQA